MIADLNSLTVKCQIFISYKRRSGEELAYLLYERLTALGYSVFFDSKALIDEDYKKAIDTKIKECTDFVVLFTANCMDGMLGERKEFINTDKEDWLAKEIRIAQKYGKHIIPIIKGDFRVPDGIPQDIEKVANLNGVFFPNTYFEEAFSRLLTVFLNSKTDDMSMESDTATLKGFQSGNPYLSNDFALKTEIGTPIIQENKSLAVERYKTAAEKGSQAAYYNIGDIYEKCAEDMHLLSKDEYNIAVPDDIEKSKYREYLLEQAKKYYISAGDYPPALYKLGIMCEKKYELDEAVKYYIKAKEQNYSPAVNAVAYFYENGLGGLERDSVKAKKLFKLAMDLNLPQAAYNYAKLRQRDMLPNEREEIINIFRFAFFSSEPIPQAAFAIGQMYEDVSDKVNALHYYYLAAETGYSPAETAIKRLNAQVYASR